MDKSAETQVKTRLTFSHPWHIIIVTGLPTPLTQVMCPMGRHFFIRKRVNLILKEPKIFEEQLTLIRGKGFIIPEGKEQECIEFFRKRIITGYRLFFLFRKKDGACLFLEHSLHTTLRSNNNENHLFT